jgi:Uma2 family endonuclease
LFTVRSLQEHIMTATGLRMTADELLHLPANGKRYELVNGELHEMAPAGGEHGKVGGRALRRLGNFLDQQPDLGGELFTAETGFRLTRDPDTVRAPDVAYVAETRLAQAIVPGYPELAPDFVVEVVSPGDRASEVQAKVDEWLRAGVRLVWVLYPQTRTAMVYQPDGSAQLLHAEDILNGDPVLPGCSIRLSDLF